MVSHTPGNRNRGVAHNRYKHGLAGTTTYKAWSGMKARCYKDTREDFKNYGARGIIVCDRWHEFQNFLSDMGECPAGQTLERKNTNGNYEPENCIWADRTTQSRNRRYTKLSEEAAERIRQLRREGRTLQWLSASFGVSVSHIHRVVTAQSWVFSEDQVRLS